MFVICSKLFARLWNPSFACIRTTGCVIIMSEKHIEKTKSLSEGRGKCYA